MEGAARPCQETRVGAEAGEHTREPDDPQAASVPREEGQGRGAAEMGAKSQNRVVRKWS